LLWLCELAFLREGSRSWMPFHPTNKH
jgi:hypothetical protein